MAYIDLSTVKALKKPENWLFVPEFKTGKNVFLKGKLEKDLIVWEIIEDTKVKHSKVEGLNKLNIKFKQDFDDNQTIIAVKFASKDPTLYCMKFPFSNRI